jgi:hypothetical protein
MKFVKNNLLNRSVQKMFSSSHPLVNKQNRELDFLFILIVRFGNFKKFFVLLFFAIKEKDKKEQDKKPKIFLLFKKALQLSPPSAMPRLISIRLLSVVEVWCGKGGGGKS